MATSSTSPIPVLSPEARLYKYVRLSSGWKYLRADYSEDRIVPHSVFPPKSTKPTIIEGGYYVAYDSGKWHRSAEDPSEAERLFKLARTTSQLSDFRLRSQP
jgi:hypothetical protein